MMIQSIVKYSLLCGLVSMSVCLNAARFVTKPYLQNMQPTEVTVMWLAADGTGMRGWVEYHAKGEPWQTAYEVSNGMFAAYNEINRVRLTNLLPGTTYQYRAAEVAIEDITDTSLVYGDTVYSNAYNFITPEENGTSVKCKIFNDLHDNYAYFEYMMAIDTMPDYDFVFFNGDMLNATPSELTITENLIKPSIRQFAPSRPFYTVRGNHEVRREWARKYFDYFTFPDNGMPSQGYYSFTWGPCFFIVLDTGEDEEDADANNLFAFDSYRYEQQAWLEQQLQSEAKQQACYTVVFEHVPTYTNTSKERHAMLMARQLFQPLFHQYGVSVVISGHTHIPGIYFATASSHHYPLVIGGGNSTSSGARDYPTMLTLDANLQQMIVTLYDMSGKKIKYLPIAGCASAVEEIDLTKEENNCEKVLFNGTLYLKRDGIYYTTMGIKVNTPI